MLLLFAALIFGGGGSIAGLLNLAVQLVALGLLALNGQAVLDFFRTAPRFIVWLVCAALLLPLVQIIPLPPLIWQSLPGRSLVVESLQLVGRQGDWMSLSLNPRRTIVAFLALVPPLAMLILSWKLPDEDRRKLLWALTASGIFVVLLGGQQLATGNQHFILFAEAFGSSDLQGTFANRNAAGLFLDIALCALVGAYPTRSRKLAWPVGGAVVGVLLLVGLVLTRSRSSMALSLVPMLLLTYRLWQVRRSGRSSRRLVIGAIAAAGLLGLGLVGLMVGNQRVQQSFSRFDKIQDPRPAIWSDTLVSIGRFWPVGSGVGTFDEVFQIDESLETITPGRAARAHNDYLEVALESGLPGIILMAGWLFAVTAICLRAVRRGGKEIVSVAVFALLAMQSILDYPLRNQTLLCVAGLMLALMIGPRTTRIHGKGTHDTGSEVR
ncbi:MULTISPECIES: O-antigen ligase [unclassified Novosphingobium]|uniref:O-antigen ligase family protein n=1 Tax=unclassified Novosphingobium TaxID=2644732 RepID=UPI00135812A2|nr:MULTISPECIES: O-antigen ligase family protein [unclassified Novosphingobium]